MGKSKGLVPEEGSLKAAPQVRDPSEGTLWDASRAVELRPKTVCLATQGLLLPTGPGAASSLGPRPSRRPGSPGWTRCPEGEAGHTGDPAPHAEQWVCSHKETHDSNFLEPTLMKQRRKIT